MILAGPDGDVTLVWGGKGREPRYLAPGAYRVRTTRVERTVERTGERRHWFLSSTAPDGEALKLVAGETAQVVVPASVRFSGNAFRKEGELRLAMSITTEGGAGLSVYANGKRVPVRYRLLSEDGDVVASGSMNYG